MRAPRTLREALMELPNTAEHHVEIAWIRCHPAMTRKEGNKRVEITLQDIRKAAHGKAPSKSAVVALMHWANNPEAFFNKILATVVKDLPADDPKQIKKKSAKKKEKAEEEEEVVDDFEDLRRYRMEREKSQKKMSSRNGRRQLSNDPQGS